jgi:hypothetical protein
MNTHSLRGSFVTLAAALVLLSSCGDGADSGSPQPILSANGTISIAGRTVVPTYGVAGLKTSGTAGVILSDAPMGCTAINAEYTSRNMPASGTYVGVALPNLDKGVAAKDSISYTVVDGSDMKGGGSSGGTVEVLDATDAAVTIRVDFRATLSTGEFIVNGDFTVSRCP